MRCFGGGGGGLAFVFALSLLTSFHTREQHAEDGELHITLQKMTKGEVWPSALFGDEKKVRGRGGHRRMLRTDDISPF